MGLCPSCLNHFAEGSIPWDGVQILSGEKGRNALSRRSKQSICSFCGRAEGLSDITTGRETEGDARSLIYRDYEEGRRLPAGHIYPVTGVISTGDVLDSSPSRKPMYSIAHALQGKWIRPGFESFAEVKALIFELMEKIPAHAEHFRGVALSSRGIPTNDFESPDAGLEEDLDDFDSLF